MGVSGSGKSTVAGILAGRLGWDLAEGDDALLNSQIATLEPPGHDENALIIDVGRRSTDEAEEIITRLQLITQTRSYADDTLDRRGSAAW